MSFTEAAGVLVDSNVLIDVATNDRVWGQWSATALAAAAERYTLAINPVIYAEVSIGYSTIEALDEALPRAIFRRCLYRDDRAQRRSARCVGNAALRWPAISRCSAPLLLLRQSCAGRFE